MTRESRVTVAADQLSLAIAGVRMSLSCSSDWLEDRCEAGGEAESKKEEEGRRSSEEIAIETQVEVVKINYIEIM